MKAIQPKQNNHMQKSKTWLWILTAGILTAVFIAFTLMIEFVGVQKNGDNNIGFAELNFWWREIIGDNRGVWNLISNMMTFVTLLGLVVILVFQVVMICRRKKLARHWWFLDLALLMLLVSYLFFEIVIVNYRPLLIDGVAEASYPSTHVLLLATFCPLIILTVWQEVSTRAWRWSILGFGIVVMVIGIIARALSGYHWLTDIIGSVLLGAVIVSWYWVFNTQYKLSVNHEKV